MRRGSHVWVVFVTTLVVVLLSTFGVYWMGLTVTWANEEAYQRRQIIEQLDDVLSDVKDAETGQRGFLLTGDERYLEPYNAALGHISMDLPQLRRWAAVQEVPSAPIETVIRLTNEKLQGLAQTILLRRSGNVEGAMAAVHSGAGKRIMDELRQQVALIKQQQEGEFANLWRQRDRAVFLRTLVTAIMALIACGVLVWAFGRIRRQVADIDEQRQLLSVTLASIGDGVIVTDMHGRVKSMNGEAERLTGWQSQEAAGQNLANVFRIVNEQTRETVESPADKVLRLGRVVGLANHTVLIARDGKETPIDDSGAPIRQADGTLHGVVLVFRDFSEQKHAEREREIVAEFLQLVNDSKGTRQLVEAAVRYFKERSGCAAVGIRLHDGDDYPYFEASGFPEAFLLAENSLCSRDAAGEVKRDAAGNPLIECMCGNVICGRFDPAKPFFTPAGSFWTNCTTELLASTSEADRQARTRNRCNGEGYESVALIPLHCGQERLGLLQLNDRRKGRFTPEIMARWERLAGHLAVALAKCKAEESLRKSAATYRSLFENMLDGFAYCQMLYDEEGRPDDFVYLEVNDAFRRLTGLENVTGRRVTQVIPGIKQMHPEVFQAYGRVAQSGQPERFEIEFRPLNAWLSVAAYSPACGYFVAVFENITERKRAEETLAAARVSAEQAKSTAEAASRAKDQFIAVLSHELRNPLNPVLTIASMLRDDPRLDADTREQAEIIRRNAQLEAVLIDDLLDVTRIERGRVELDRQPVELGTILHRAAEVCMQEIESRELRFSIDATDDPCWISADPARLQQVFWNLIKNAVKFTPHGGQVSIRCRRDGAGHVIVEVHDTGEGIEPELLPRLFNAFEQGQRPVARQFGGLGLGLAISKAMVEVHGGTICATSEGKGKGACFIVRLPLLASDPAVSPVTPTSESPRPDGAVRPLRVLLVEDHADTARMMRRLLTAGGHQVETAGDVATALKLAEQQSFDVLLSDLGLPDGSGHDLMRTLRDKGLMLPGIAVSGYGQEQDVQESRRAGFMVHLVKPVSIARLKEALAIIAGTSATVGEQPIGPHRV